MAELVNAMNRMCRVLFPGVLLAASLHAQSPRRTATVELAAKAEPCVVAVYSEAGATGSGSVISSRGFILTNDHVVRNKNGRVLFHDGSVRPYRILGRSPEKDLAIIQVPVKEPLPALPLGRSDDVMTGEPVLIAGNPGGRGIVFSSGIVSSPRMMINSPSALVMQQFPGDARDRFIQFDAASNPGNSGGPMINAEGRQIAVVAVGNKAEQNINFAIPIDRLRSRVTKMIAPEVKGNFHLGLECDPFAERAVVASVAKDSPAAKAGLQPGDILVSLGDLALAHGLDWTLALVGGEPGKTATLQWTRHGENHSAQLTTSPYPLRAAEEKGEAEPGLRFAVYELDQPVRLPDFRQLTPVNVGVATTLDPRRLEPNRTTFGLVLEGLVEIQTDNWCRLIIESDDGSRVLFHGETIIDNDGRHPPQEASVLLRAAKGWHPLRIEYFEMSGDSTLRLFLEMPDGQRTELGKETLAHRKPSGAAK